MTMTESEKMERKDEWKKDKSKKAGNCMVGTRCPACGCNERDMTNRVLIKVKFSSVSNRMRCTCDRCGYCWDEEPLFMHDNPDNVE